MSVNCPITGTAIVTLIHGKPKWLRTDSEVHVTTELLDDSQAREEIERVYRIGEPCEVVAGTVHAYRHEEGA